MSGVSGLRGWRAGAIATLSGATAGLLVVLLVGGGDLWPSGDSGSSVEPAPSATAPRVTDPAPGAAPSVLPSAPTTVPPLPSTSGIEAVLAKPLRAPALGSRVGLIVVDPATGQTLFAQDADQMQTPASTMKTVTAASVLHYVGPDATLKTRTVAGATARDVVLVGGGDPTITRTGSTTYPRRASLNSLARQTATALKAQSITSVRLVLDDSLFTGPRTGPGWLPADLRSGLVSRVSALTIDAARVGPGGDARYADPTAAAGRGFVAALKKYGVQVTTTSRGVAPTGAVELAAVSSPPIAALVEHMLLTSDNDVAEVLAHLAGAAAGTGASFAGGAAASNQTLTWLGIDAGSASIVDGSGISRRNLLDAALLGAVVAAPMRADRPELASLLSGLPVAGVNGSLAERFDGPSTKAARGQVRAKTGTLIGVHSLAGTVLDREGRTLVFVVLADRASIDTVAARAALDRVAAALETCGCR